METIDKIKQLIDRYFAGETSLGQEEELRVFFTSGNIPDDLKQYQAIFGYFAAERNKHQNKTSDDDCSADLSNKSIKNNKTMWLKIAGLAASVILLLAIGINIRPINTNNVLCQGTFVIIDGKCTNDPQQISKSAIDAIDAIISPITEAAEGIDILIGENSNIINQHVRALDQLEE